MGDFGSNRAAWLIAGFLGRKFMKDMIGRWSVLPVLAVGLCVWNKWNARRLECKAEQRQLEETRRQTRQQLHVLQKKSAAGLLPPTQLPNGEHQRRGGDRLGGGGGSGGLPSTIGRGTKQQHVSARAANGVGSAVPKDALATELWAWLGGVGVGRVCGADRSTRTRGGGGGGGAGGGGGSGEWRGAFTNRMGNLPRRNAFKTARGKVYLRSASRRPGCLVRAGEPVRVTRALESVREEDEASLPP